MRAKTTNTILYCKKWQETVRFYAEILKLEVNFSNEWFVEFTLNTHSRLSVADHNRSSIKSSDGQGITIALQVEDSLTLHEHLSQSGANPTPMKKLWGADVFYVTDPEGSRIEFWSEQTS